MKRLAIWFLLLSVSIQAALAGTTTQEAYVKASNTDEGDRFGQSIAVSGNRKWRTTRVSF